MCLFSRHLKTCFLCLGLGLMVVVLDVALPQVYMYMLCRVSVIHDCVLIVSLCEELTDRQMDKLVTVLLWDK